MASSLADQLVTAYVAQELSTGSSTDPDEAAKVLESVLNALRSGRLTLLDLVKASGPTLTSEEEDTRKKGVRLLGGVVEGASTGDDVKLITRNDVRVLTDFLCDKLADEPVALDAIGGLAALTSSPSFGVSETIQTCTALFARVTTQKMPQPARMQVFYLLDCLMSRQRRGLKRMGDAFLDGYCKIAEGEKDPRILMIAFRLDKVILTEFEIANKVEDLFDITFCYFPITFRTSPNDPHGIKSEDLQLGLRECLASTPRFGILALPLFLDKLQASSANAKTQSLQALAAAFPVYGQAVVSEFCLTFWEAFSVEVFHASDTDTEQLALEATQSLFQTVYPPSSTSPFETKHEPLIERLLKSVLDELSEPDKQKAKSAASIVAALIRSDASVALVRARVLRETVGTLMQLWRNPDDVSMRGGMLERVATVAEAVQTAVAAAAVADPEKAPGLLEPLTESKDELLAMLVSGAQTQTSKVQGLKAVLELARVPGLLGNDELKFAVGTLDDALMGSDEEASDAALDGIAILAELHPRTIEALTLPLLFRTLPDRAAADAAGKLSYMRSLGALAAICDRPTLFEPLVVRILSRLELVCTISDDAPTRAINALYAHHLLATLRAVTVAKIKAGHGDLPNYFARAGPRLLAIFVLDSLSQQPETVAADPRLAVDAGKVLTLLVQQLDTKRQDVLSASMHACFSKGQLSPLLADAVRNFAPQTAFQPMNPDSPDRQQNTLILFTAVVIAFRQDVHVPEERLSRFSHAFLLHAVSTATPLQRRAACQLLCSTVNRRAQDFPEFFAEELPAFWHDTVEDASLSQIARLAALQLWSWIAKALIVRSDNRGYACVDRLFETFATPIGRDAARCLGIVAQEGDEVLSRENFAVVRLLWKQRFYNHIIPKLLNGFAGSQGDLQAVHLVGLASILTSVPANLVLDYLPKLMPLLLQALRLPDQDLRANVLEALVALSNSSQDRAATVIAESAETLVDILLDNVIPPPGESRTVPVKVASLQLLATLPSSIPYTSLHSQKSRIIRLLGQAVDDKAKAVRREAVDCRARWYSFKGSV